MMPNALRPRAVIALLLLAVLLPACQSKADKMVYQANEKAKEALKHDPATKKKMFEEARDELRQAVQLDPNNKDGYVLLCQLDEVLGHADDAARDFPAASALDPTNQKLMTKARYYRYLQQLGQQADKALDTIKSGDAEQGMNDLFGVLKDVKTKEAADHALSDLKQAMVIVVQQGDQLAQQKKYVDAVKDYEQSIRGYMLLARAQKQEQLDPAADEVMRKANHAAQQGGAPDLTFKMFNDVLGVDPDNKTANMELAQVYIRRDPPDYSTAADLMERAGASDSEVKKLRAKAKHH